MVDTEDWNTLLSMIQASGLQYGLRQEIVLKRLRDRYRWRSLYSRRYQNVNRHYSKCTCMKRYFPLKFKYTHLTLANYFMHAEMTNNYWSLHYINNSPHDAFYMQIWGNRNQAQITVLLRRLNINSRSIHNKKV